MTNLVNSGALRSISDGAELDVALFRHQWLLGLYPRIEINQLLSSRFADQAGQCLLVLFGNLLDSWCRWDMKSIGLNIRLGCSDDLARLDSGRSTVTVDVLAILELLSLW